jgi:3-hydroxyacyl-[acyl-carrier-protein] dehydratase
MHFSLIDRILSRDEDSLTAIKHVSAAEEYLQDHFPTYPVLPGVLMLEAMVQAARELAGNPCPPLVLGKVAALKYGAMVRPGDSIVIHVQCADLATSEPIFRGEVRLMSPLGTPTDQDLPRAASGKLTLRAVRAIENRNALRNMTSKA